MSDRRPGDPTSHSVTKALMLAMAIELDRSPTAKIDQAIHQSNHLRMYNTVAKQRRRAGRNDPCPCMSGLKHKRCCMIKKAEPESAE